MTKQAARKRFLPKDPGDVSDPAAQDFSRFTPRAKNTIMAAHAMAHDAGHQLVQPEHLVLGLLSEPDALAAKAMQRRVSLAEIRKAITAGLPPDGSASEGLVPYSDDSKKVLELTFREALRLGHNYIGTEHILLALLEAEPDDSVLASFGLVKPDVEDDLLSLLTKGT